VRAVPVLTGEIVVNVSPLDGKVNVPLSGVILMTLMYIGWTVAPTPESSNSSTSTILPMYVVLETVQRTASPTINSEPTVVSTGILYAV